MPKSLASKAPFLGFAKVHLITMLLSAHSAHAADLCAPALAVKAALDQLPQQTPAQTDWQFREQRAAALQAVLHQYPDDMFVQREYIRSLYSRKDKDKVIAEYKARHEKKPDRAQLAYLYGVALVGRQSQQAIKLFTRALEKDPKVPWPHLQLADIYSSPAFLNNGESIAHLKAFLDACPTSLEGYEPLTRVDEKDLLLQYAANLRALIANRKDADAIGAYGTLWAIEFKASAASDDALRKQVSQDLQRIRMLNLQDKREWYAALENGYTLVNDQGQADWAKEQGESHFPRPGSLVAMSKWFKDHHYPAENAPAAGKQTFFRDLLGQTDQWTKQRPNATFIWMQRLDAMKHLDDVSTSDVKMAVDKTYEVAMANAGPDGPGSNDYFNFAELLCRKYFQPERAAEFAQKGLAQWEIESTAPYYDLYATKENLEDYKFYRAYSRLKGLELETEAYLQLKQPDKAESTMVQMDERLQQLKSLGEGNDHKKAAESRRAPKLSLQNASPVGMSDIPAVRPGKEDHKKADASLAAPKPSQQNASPVGMPDIPAVRPGKDDHKKADASLAAPKPSQQNASPVGMSDIPAVRPGKQEHKKADASLPAPQPSQQNASPVGMPDIPAVRPGPGRMYLQVAAMPQPQGDALVSTLKQNGSPALLAKGPNPKLYRVMVGPFADPSTLSKAKADLEKAGYHPIVRK